MKLRELRDKISEPGNREKLLSKMEPAAKPAIITAAIIAGAVAVIFLMFAMTGEEDISDFLKRWEQVMESGDDRAYDEICSEDFKEKFNPRYERIKSLIAGQEIDVSIEDEGIEKPFAILSTLDYDIQWQGLDLDNSSIRKKQRGRQR